MSNKNIGVGRLRLSLVLAIVLYLSLFGLFYYYFYQVRAESQYMSFYKNIRLGDVRISVDEIRSYLEGGTVSELARRTVDSAFVRYQLDEGVFTRYVKTLENGLWLSPAAKDWANLFSSHIIKWRAGIDPETNKPGELVLGRSGDQSPIMVFANKPLTNAVGRRVKVTVRVPEDKVVQEPAVWLWFADGPEGYFQSEARFLSWKPNVITSGSATLAELHVDLGIDPAWFNTQYRLNGIQITGTRASEWEIIAAAFDF